MPEVSLSGQFKPTLDGSSAGSSAPLGDVLSRVVGLPVVSQDLSDNVKQSAINVTSVFAPNPCTAEKPPTGTTPGGGSGTPTPPPPAPGGDGSDMHFEGGGHEILQPPPAELRIALPLREKLIAIGSQFNELIALLERPATGATPAVAPVAMRGPQQDPKCWRYQHTNHGPTGLVRSRELLHVRVGGFIETLGGLKKVGSNVDYLMYMEYSVNTYLQGKAAWSLDPATQDVKFDSQVTLNPVNGCFGTADAVAGLKSCGSDSVSDVLRVVITFKKVLVCEFNANANGIAAAGNLDAYMARMTWQTFAGVMPFTHSMDAPATSP